jgi:hypothetical protein
VRDWQQAGVWDALHQRLLTPKEIVCPADLGAPPEMPLCVVQVHNVLIRIIELVL